MRCKLDGGRVAVSATASYSFPAGATVPGGELHFGDAPVLAVIHELEAPRVMMAGSTGLGVVELASLRAGGWHHGAVDQRESRCDQRTPDGEKFRPGAAPPFRIRSFGDSSARRVEISVDGDSVKTVRIQVRPQIGIGPDVGRAIRP